MYTILNERGTNKEGRIVYDVFGVGLANTSNGHLDFDLVRNQLNQMKKNSSKITSSDYALIRMLNDSDQKSVFSNSLSMNFFERMEKHEDLSSLINCNKNYFYWSRFLTFYYLETYYPHFLEMAKRCFEFPNLSSSPVSSDLLLLIKMAQSLNLRMIKKTQIKEIVLPPHPTLKMDWTTLFLPLFRANTLSMMLLIGETSYYNDKTKSIPIVMGGEESKISDSYQFKRNLKKK